MKLLKKWLFPALTCLIVLGATALPPLISQARDAQLFGQVHAELLDASPLSAAQASTLPDRIALYVDRYSADRPILSYSDAAYWEDSQQKELAQAAQAMLTEAGVLPRWIFDDEPFENLYAARLLLWDPADGSSAPTPTVFWEISWEHYSNKNHQKEIKATLDAETGLPIHLWVHDTNMSQWLPYDTDHLFALAEPYFNLLGLEVQEEETDDSMLVPSLNLSYSIVGTDLGFFVSREPTGVIIQPDMVRQFSLHTDGPTDAAG